MNYKQVIKKLKSVDPSTCFPLYVPSVLRPDHFLYRNVIQYLPEWYRKEKVTYLTRKEWYKKYKTAQPDVRIEVIPKEYEYDGYGTDTTRKCLFDLAHSRGDKFIFDWDDDIDCLTMAYSADGTTRRLRKDDQHTYALQLMTLASNVSKEYFDKYPDLCLGQLGRVSPSTCLEDYHKTKIVINKGGIPRMSNIIAVERMKQRGMERTGEFDLQMEDMGIDFKVIGLGGWCFTLPTIMHTVPPIEKNPRTEPILHGEETALWKDGLEKLLKLPAGPYVTYTSINKKYFGMKRPIGINWNRWNNDHGISSIIEEW